MEKHLKSKTDKIQDMDYDFVEVLEKAEKGFFVENEDNGRKVEVACMAGGRYLCLDPDGEPVRQTNSEAVAYLFLVRNPDPKDQHK